MKFLLTLITVLVFTFSTNATDPIRKKTFYLEMDVNYSFYHYYRQALFQRSGLCFGGSLGLGHHQFPVALEYRYQLPSQYSYRNNEISDQFQEIGIKYNLNHLTYLIPYGLDPYVGASLMQRKNRFTQYAIGEANSQEVLRDELSVQSSYKLSAGVKVGNRLLRFGLHYDYLPRGLNISQSEGPDLIVHNSVHMISAKVGIRLSAIPGNRIKCPM